MFIIIFGSIILSLKIEKNLIKSNYDYMIQNATIKRTFVKIERIQNKSFFGFNHYYFTLSFWHQGKMQNIVKKVNSTLYYKYKEGSEVEAILVLDFWNYPRIFLIPQIIEERSLEEVKYKNIETLSMFFLNLGIIMIVFYFIYKSNHKKRLYEEN